jgi:hypothetical protein
MTLIHTSEPCPECGCLVFMVAWPKKQDNLTHVVIDFNGTPHGIADAIYLDRDGVLNVVQFDENTQQPDYFCMHCEWSA